MLYQKQSNTSKMRYILLSVLAVSLVGILMAPVVSSQQATIPAWIKNNAMWWASDQIPDSAFLQGIQFLIKEGIMVIPFTETSASSQSQEVPPWIKNTAGWWAEDKISEVEFVNAIQYLIKVGIVIIPQDGNISTDSSAIKPSIAILNTTSFFEVEVDILCEQSLQTAQSQCTGLYNMNSEGFRGSEFSKDKPDNTYRIIAVGGSTTFGSGVTNENTWPKILEKKLQNLSESKKIEVINSGISGMNSFSESKLIKQKLIHYKPDLIIVYDGMNDVGCKMREHITKEHVATKEVRIKL